MITATLGALVVRSPIGLVVGRHASATAAAIDDALAQRQSLAGRARAGARGVGGQALLIGQVLLPTDKAGMVVLDHHRPLRARLFHGRLANGPIRSNRLSRAVSAKHIRTGVRRVRQNADGPRMRQPTPAQLTSPGSTIGATRKPSIDEGADHAVGGASRLE